MSAPTRLGAVLQSDGSTRFEVWAPDAHSVDVLLDGDGRRVVPLGRDDEAGTWLGVVDGIGHGDRYRFRLDGGEALADPASGWQPVRRGRPLGGGRCGAGSAGRTTAGEASS